MEIEQEKLILEDRLDVTDDNECGDGGADNDDQGGGTVESTGIGRALFSCYTGKLT